MHGRAAPCWHKGCPGGRTCAQYGCRNASSGEMRLSGLKCSRRRSRSSASGEAEGKVASSRGVAGARMDSSIVAAATQGAVRVGPSFRQLVQLAVQPTAPVKLQAGSVKRRVCSLPRAT